MKVANHIFVSILLLQSCGGTIGFNPSLTDKNKNKVKPSLVDEGKDGLKKDGEVVQESKNDGAVKPEIINGSAYLYCEIPVTDKVKGHESSVGCAIASNKPGHVGERIDLKNVPHTWRLLYTPTSKKAVRPTPNIIEDHPYFDYAFIVPADALDDLTIRFESEGFNPPDKPLKEVLEYNANVAANLPEIESDFDASQSSKGLKFSPMKYLQLGNGQRDYQTCGLQYQRGVTNAKKTVELKFNISANIDKLKINFSEICGIQMANNTIHLVKAGNKVAGSDKSFKAKATAQIFEYGALEQGDYVLVITSAPFSSYDEHDNFLLKNIFLESFIADQPNNKLDP